MYEIILGAASESIWLKGGGNIEFRRDYSTCVLQAANLLANLNVFDYELGQNIVAGQGALGAMGGAAGQVTDLFTSTFRSNQVNETMIATHLRIKILPASVDAATPATDVPLLNAAYTQIVTRTVFDLYHESQKGADVSGFVEEFPAGEGGDYFGTAGALQYAKNGPPHISAARPLPRPRLYKSGQDPKTSPYAGGPTFLRGTARFGEGHGGITAGTITAILVYLDGYMVV